MKTMNSKMIPLVLDRKSASISNNEEILRDVIAQNDQLSSMNNLLSQENEKLKEQLQKEKNSRAEEQQTISVLQNRLLQNNLSIVDTLIEEGMGGDESPLDRFRQIVREHKTMREVLRAMENVDSVQNIVKESQGLKLASKVLQKQLAAVEKERDAALESLKESSEMKDKRIAALLQESRRLQVLEKHQNVLCQSFENQQDQVSLEARQLSRKLKATMDSCSKLTLLLDPNFSSRKELESLRARVKQLDETKAKQDHLISALKQSHYTVLQYNKQWQTYNYQREEHVNQLKQAIRDLQRQLVRTTSDTKQLVTPEGEVSNVVDCAVKLSEPVRTSDQLIRVTTAEMKDLIVKQEPHADVEPILSTDQARSEELMNSRRELDARANKIRALEEELRDTKEMLEQQQVAAMAHLSERRKVARAHTAQQDFSAGVDSID